MFQFLFFAKALVLTIVIVFALQLKVGETTLEQKASLWIQQSSLLEPLRATAQNGVLAIKSSFHALSQKFRHRLDSSWGTDQIAGKRSVGFHLQRSESYLRQQAEKFKQDSHPEIDSSTPLHSGEQEEPSP